MTNTKPKPIKATFSQVQADKCTDYDNRNDKRECVKQHRAFVISKGGIKCPINVFWYMGKSASAMTVYCEVSISNQERYTSGTGYAGGGGYDKYSASLASALNGAGYDLSESIHGVGEYAIYRAIEGICKNLGYTGKVYHF